MPRLPSIALQQWLDERVPRLDEVRAAHTAIAGPTRGRKYATQQVNQAYLLMVAGQFQGFCRDLHTEATDYLVSVVRPVALRNILRASLVGGRQLDRGNAQPGSLGSDFARLGLDLWPAILALHRWNATRRERLEELNAWRNAIAHQNFDPQRLGGRTEIWLQDVDRYRSTCQALTVMLDRVAREQVEALTGSRPW